MNYAEALTFYLDYFHSDAKKVIPKIGGKRPGKRCKKGWIPADKQCSDHKQNGKLTEAGKASAQELAEKVRKRKGLKPLDKSVSTSDNGRKLTGVKGMKLPKLEGSEKQVAWAEKIRQARVEHFNATHKTYLDNANGREASGNHRALGATPDGKEKLESEWPKLEAWFSENVFSQSSARWWIDNRDVNFATKARMSLRNK